MLKLEQLVALSGQNNGRRTLSAYVPVEADTANPGAAWRALLRQGIARARDGLTHASHHERTEFDRCATQLMERADADMHMQGGGTWIGIASTDDFIHDETVPALLPSLVTWEPSARIAPYIAVLDSQHALIVVADRVHAVFYRIEDGEMKEIDRIDTEPRGGEGTHTSKPPKQSFHMGTRGSPGTDVAARQAATAFRKHRAAIVDRVHKHEKAGEAIILGGAHEAVAKIAPLVAAHATDRFVVSDALSMTSTDAQLRAAARAGLGELRARRHASLIADLLNGDRHPQLNVLDRETLDAALTLRNVNTLVLSSRWMSENTDAAEDLVRRALAQSATVEIANGSEGEGLDEGSGGVAAKLRFSVA